MLYAYRSVHHGLERLEVPGGSLVEDGAGPVTVPEDAVWIDIYRPLPAQAAAVAALGFEVPTLEDMEEIEISNRLYHADGIDVLTVVLPGQNAEGQPSSGPVAFLLGPDRLVTVRHHAPRPFETFPPRAARSTAGCAGPDQVFLGLAEEIVARLADLLENAGKALDETARGVFGGQAGGQPELLQAALERVGMQGELISRVRLGIVTMERALSFFGTGQRSEMAKEIVKGEMRDLRALSVHADYLTSRVGLTVDATLGMINLAQNATVRIVSVVAVLFLPPTLVASAYGMNFEWMPGLRSPWGFEIALALMVASAVGTWAVFRWRRWL